MKSFPILPITEVKSSGALPPAAIIVAPATSSDMSSFSVMTLTVNYYNLSSPDCHLTCHPSCHQKLTSRAGTKNSSQTIARAQNI